MENSKIEWTHHTFNPWIGCTKVSPGCRHCYAETLMDTRYGRVKWGAGQPRSRTAAANWKKPEQWDRQAKWENLISREELAERGVTAPEERPRVFCASLADWLDDEVPIEWLADLLGLIHATPHLDWLLLTKRPGNWRKRMAAISGCYNLDTPSGKAAWGFGAEWYLGEKAPANVWIGTSAEDQTRWDERMPLLMDIPARVRFVSAEPLLGPVTMGELRPDWLIVGGESGPGARPMETDWAETLCNQCDGRTAFHFKQWGGVDKKAAGRLLLGRTWDELPRTN